ncbi:MAG: S26 family signal peptidase [Myxococcota bacterium]|nr:S26 family signal peptidase [Myxococcota bacterium]
MTIEYGSPSRMRKSPLTAHLLNLLFPGVGHLYWGARQGALVASGLVLSCCGLILYWFQVPSHPLPLLCGFALFWSLLVVVLTLHFRKLPPHGVLRHPLSPSPPLVRYLLYVIGGLTPLALAFFAFQVTFRLERISESSMFPLILAGDTVLIDQRSYIERAPRVGELVAFQRERAQVQVARVVAKGGESLILEHGVPSESGRAISHVELVELQLPNLQGKDATRLRRSIAYLENNHGVSYPVFYARYPERFYPSLPINQVAVGSVYVLPDNRDALKNEKIQFGEVYYAELIGKPLYIYSHQERRGETDETGQMAHYLGRRGLPLN